LATDDFLSSLEHITLGIGIDIECISRFRTEFRGRLDESLSRIFSAEELDYCFSHQDYAPHLAARYCAKEAMTKALTSIGIGKLKYNEIEVHNDKENVPAVRIRREGLPALRSFLSLSHCEDKALAFAVVIAERHATPEREKRKP
jgi:holo-[acyl-carrier protein] synthase